MPETFSVSPPVPVRCAVCVRYALRALRCASPHPVTPPRMRNLMAYGCTLIPWKLGLMLELMAESYRAKWLARKGKVKRCRRWSTIA